MLSYLGRWDNRAHYVTEATALPCHDWLTSQFAMNSRKRKRISNIHGELEPTHRLSRYQAWKGGWHHHGSLFSNRPSTGLSHHHRIFLAGDCKFCQTSVVKIGTEELTLNEEIFSQLPLLEFKSWDFCKGQLNTKVEDYIFGETKDKWNLT